MLQRWGGFLCIIACVALGQQAPAPDPSDATFRATSKLMQVSVIAQDRQGKPVTDLRQDEFQLIDNGTQQNLRLFLNETERLSSTLPPGTFDNRASSRSGAHSGYSVIVLDTLLTLLADENQGGSGAIWAIQKSLQTLRTLPPGESVAIYATGVKVRVIREFTLDHASLEQKLRTWKPATDVIPADDRPEVLRREIDRIATRLADIPGRKNLIWIGYQFPVGPKQIQKLRAADVAVYPVDAHGSVIGLQRDKELASMPLRGLAAATGGVAFFDRDDIETAVREAIDDGRSSYTLGFYPSGDENARQLHQIAIRTTRPGVALRYRNSYETAPPRKPEPAKPADLIQAMDNPADAVAIPILASAKRVSGPAKQERLNFDAVLGVADLDLASVQNRWTGKIEVVAQFMSADGSIVGDRPALAQTVSLKLRQSTYDQAAQRGLPYHNELKIPAKAVECKLLVANMATGKIGTVTIPLSEVVADAPAR